MIDSRFGERRIQHPAQFGQADIGILKPHYCYFMKCFWKIIKIRMLLNKPDAFGLPERGINGFAQVCRFAVYDAIDLISHFLHDPDVFKAHQGVVGTCDIEKIHDLLAFLKVYQIIPLAQDVSGLHPELLQILNEFIGLELASER